MELLLVSFSSSESELGAGFAQSLGLPFDILCLTGSAPLDLGARKVIDAGLEEVPPADALDDLLPQILKGYTHVAAVSSMQSKDLMARIAGLVDGVMVADVISAASPTSFKRPMAAGSVLTTVETDSFPIVLTFRPASFAKVERGGQSGHENRQLVASSRVTRLSRSKKTASRPDLTQARVVVSGGRPLKDAETFERVIGGLADILGGAAGATRAAVDSGIAPNELQVGQTGKVVAPELYVAAGISGSTQHVAGIKDSKVIVAINKDPDAPIFEVADFGLVADLYDAIPNMIEKLKK